MIELLIVMMLKIMFHHAMIKPVQKEKICQLKAHFGCRYLTSRLELEATQKRFHHLETCRFHAQFQRSKRKKKI